MYQGPRSNAPLPQALGSYPLQQPPRQQQQQQQQQECNSNRTIFGAPHTLPQLRVSQAAAAAAAAKSGILLPRPDSPGARFDQELFSNLSTPPGFPTAADAVTSWPLSPNTARNNAAAAAAAATSVAGDIPQHLHMHLAKGNTRAAAAATAAAAAAAAGRTLDSTGLKLGNREPQPPSEGLSGAAAAAAAVFNTPTEPTAAAATAAGVVVTDAVQTHPKPARRHGSSAALHRRCNQSLHGVTNKLQKPSAAADNKALSSVPGCSSKAPGSRSRTRSSITRSSDSSARGAVGSSSGSSSSGRVTAGGGSHGPAAAGGGGGGGGGEGQQVVHRVPSAGVEEVQQYTGVQKLGSGQWRAQISMRAGKMLQLGTYTTAQEAALVFNKFARIKNHFMTCGNRHKLNHLADGPLLSTPLTAGAPCVLAGLREGCAREFSDWLQGHQAACVLAEEQRGTWTLTVTLSAQ